MAEIKRYTSSPTQPLSYLFGRHMIERLKADVQARQGADFDLRGFHDTLLYGGTMPVELRASSVRAGRPMRAIRAAVLAAGLAVVAAACNATGASPTPPAAMPGGGADGGVGAGGAGGRGHSRWCVTGAVDGEFAIELRGDEAPIATANFVALARCGNYEGIWFHRILAGFVIQAGDPGTKDSQATSRGSARGARYQFEISLRPTG